MNIAPKDALEFLFAAAKTARLTWDENKMLGLAVQVLAVEIAKNEVKDVQETLGGRAERDQCSAGE